MVQDEALDDDIGPLDAGPEVLEQGHRARDDVDVDLELDAVHAQRVVNPVLLIDDELLGNDVDDLPVGGDGNGFRLLEHPADVLLGDFPVPSGDGDDAPAVEALDVGARNADERGVDLLAGHQLGVRPGFLDRLGRFVEVDDDALAQAARFGRADADDLDLALLVDFSDQDGDRPRPDVDADDISVFGHDYSSSTAAFR